MPPLAFAPLVLAFHLTAGAAPDAGAEASRPAPGPLAPLGAPLGRIGDIVQPPPPGGRPGEETVVVAKFPGCEKSQAIYVSRFLLMGAAVAGEEIQQWLTRHPDVQRRLFGRRAPLVEGIRKARSGSFFEGRPCDPGGWPVTSGRIAAARAPRGLCKLERGPVAAGGTWLFARNDKGRVTQRQFTGAVALLPPSAGASNRCLPVLSAALFDDAGKTVLRYHADYNGEVQVELLGQKCQRVLFAFDPGTQTFVPAVGRDPACTRAR